jgi:ElaB/YqjD/DUF883 family membrane-anchored ribosome-binding protein
MNIQETLVEEAKLVGNRVQERLKASAGVVGDKAAEVHARVHDGLRAAQDRLSAVGDTVKAKGREGVAATELYVRANPWRAVGIAAGVGLVLGIGFTVGAILNRRRRRD